MNTFFDTCYIINIIAIMPIKVTMIKEARMENFAEAMNNVITMPLLGEMEHNVTRRLNKKD